MTQQEITPPKIAILLGSYNGESYIAEQIQSLLAQTYTRWELYVQDDHSKDRTREIVAEFSARDARIHLLPIPAKHLGAKNNFFSLMQQIEAPYYMFCDQDDVWLPTKIADTLTHLQGIEAQYPGRAITVHTDLTSVDAKLQTLHPSTWRYMKNYPELLTTPNTVAGMFAGVGCTMLFNRAARDLALPPRPEALMHDNWVVFTTVLRGGIVSPLNKSTILYRQHGGNTIGAVRSEAVITKLLRFGLNYFLYSYRFNRRFYEMVHAAGYGSWMKFVFYRLRYTYLSRRAMRQEARLEKRQEASS